jgi:hypothetical protein
MKTINQRTGIRLTARAMENRDWRLLSLGLPAPVFPYADSPATRWSGEPRFSEFQWALWRLTWSKGLPSADGDKFQREIWRGLAGGPYRAGVFSVERAGRWGIVFVVDATARSVRRHRRGRAVTGFDAAFERDFERRSRAANGTRA